MLAPGVKVRDTADWDTPANRATSTDDGGFACAMIPPVLHALLIYIPEALNRRTAQTLRAVRRLRASYYRQDTAHCIAMQTVLQCYASLATRPWKSIASY